LVDQKEENRINRRDVQAYKRKHGMRVVGQSVKNIAGLIRRKVEDKGKVAI